MRVVYRVVYRCPICGKEFSIEYSSLLSTTFMMLKLTEEIIEHVRKEHSNDAEFNEVMRKLRNELNWYDEVLEEEMYVQ